MPTVRLVLRRLLGEEKALPILAQKAVKSIESYSWPENTDTMEAVLTDALKKSKNGKITLEDLPPEIRS